MLRPVKSLHRRSPLQSAATSSQTLGDGPGEGPVEAMDMSRADNVPAVRSDNVPAPVTIRNGPRAALARWLKVILEISPLLVNRSLSAFRKEWHRGDTGVQALDHCLHIRGLLSEVRYGTCWRALTIPTSTRVQARCQNLLPLAATRQWSRPNRAKLPGFLVG